MPFDAVSLRSALAGALCLVALPGAALDLGAMSPAERAAFGAEVRAYLLENPEVLIEAYSVLEERQAEAEAEADKRMVASNEGAIFGDTHSWVGGNPEGDLTLVEFVDYRCSYCRRAHDEVAALVQGDGNIRLVMKEFPILGPESVLAARFAIATLQLAGAEAYKQAHDSLIAFRGQITPEALEGLAAMLGLDGAAILARMPAPEVTEVIEANHALAQRLEVSGTPSFVFEDRMLRGYLPRAAMAEIAEELRAGG